MKSQDYRNSVRQISVQILRRRFPNLNKVAMNEAAKEISINVHARMYGANVDNVESPLWRDDQNLPTVDASELLKETPQ